MLREQIRHREIKGYKNEVPSASRKPQCTEPGAQLRVDFPHSSQLICPKNKLLLVNI